MSFFTGIYIAEHSMSFAFARIAGARRKLICYTSSLGELDKVSDIAFHCTSYGEWRRHYDEPERLTNILSDIAEFKSTTFCFLDGKAYSTKTVTAFLTSRRIPYRVNYSEDTKIEEKKSYAESTYPEFLSRFRQNEKVVPETLYKAIYSTSFAEDYYLDYLKKPRIGKQC